MANHMEEVAKMLGVEINEEFYINEIIDKGLFHFKWNGLYNSHGSFCVKIFTNLLTGIYTVCKLYKPKIQEPYFSVHQDGDIARIVWFGNTGDLCYYKLGNCYRTRDEAEANRDK